MGYLKHALVIGVGATLVMDTWGIVRRPLLGLPRLDYGLLGRWFGHMVDGRFRHQAIAAAEPIPRERLIGWTMHYLIGVSFAVLLLGTTGPEWLDRPTLGPALLIGMGTSAAPLLVMQPAMGGTGSPRANVARLQSLVTHTVYGLGLYLAGWADHLLLRP